MSGPRKRWAMSPEKKVDAREAARILEGTGLSLAEVARRAVAGRLAINRVLFSEVCDRFMLALVKSKPRGTTVRWYENKLAPAVLALGAKMMDDITRVDLIDIGKAQAVSDATVASYNRAVRAVFRWAKQQEPPLVGADVSEGLPTSSTRDEFHVTGILTVEDAETIMNGVGKYCSAISLMLFAGVRPQEMWGIDKPPLCWKHILFEERIIRIPAEIAKTGKPRILEGLPPTVWQWLTPGKPDEPISTVSSQHLIRLAQRAGGFSKKINGKHCVLRPWPYDAVRHSFGTYALAFTGNPGLVALWMGHEGDPRMLYVHYRGLAFKSGAIRYFGVVPLQLIINRRVMIMLLDARLVKRRRRMKNVGPIVPYRARSSRSA